MDHWPIACRSFVHDVQNGDEGDNGNNIQQ
jgi:hypothetical protein